MLCEAMRATQDLEVRENIVQLLWGEAGEGCCRGASPYACVREVKALTVTVAARLSREHRSAALGLDRGRKREEELLMLMLALLRGGRTGGWVAQPFR